METQTNKSMKHLFLLLVLLAAAGTAAAEQPPASYMELKAKCRNMSGKKDQGKFVRDQVITGVVVGGAIFALNEYFIWSHNEAFHNVMPYVAMGYALYQTVNIVAGKSVDYQRGLPGNLNGNGIILLRF